MSTIQNSNRRVVLVHGDEISLVKIMKTAHRLKLFDKSRYWFLMDGLIGHRIASATFPTQFNLPTGMLALHQKSIVQEPATLYAIANLLGDLALALHSDATNASLDLLEPWHRISCQQANIPRSRQQHSQRLYR